VYTDDAHVPPLIEEMYLGWSISPSDVRARKKPIVQA